MASIITADSGGVSGSAGLKQSADSSGILALATGTGTTAVTIDASQNVGIGTSSPSEKLTVNGGIVARGDSTTPAGTSGVTLGYDTTNLIGNIYSLTSGTAWRDLAIRSNQTVFFGGGTERARIDSSGNLLVNAAAQFDSCKFGVKAGLNSFNGIVIQNTDGFGGNFQRFLNSAGSIAGTIVHNGTTTVQYATSSDYRLKENVQPMSGALATVQQLKPCTYTWKEDGSAGQGFIAHELQEVVPDAATGSKDAVDSDGNPVYQGIDTSFLVATLTAAIQEQQAIITTLTERITALENK